MIRTLKFYLRNSRFALVFAFSGWLVDQARGLFIGYVIGAAMDMFFLMRRKRREPEDVETSFARTQAEAAQMPKWAPRWWLRTTIFLVAYTALLNVVWRLLPLLANAWMHITGFITAFMANYVPAISGYRYELLRLDRGELVPLVQNVYAIVWLTVFVSLVAQLARLPELVGHNAKRKYHPNGKINYGEITALTIFVLLAVPIMALLLFISFPSLPYPDDLDPATSRIGLPRPTVYLIVMFLMGPIGAPIFGMFVVIWIVSVLTLILPKSLLLLFQRRSEPGKDSA